MIFACIIFSCLSVNVNAQDAETDSLLRVVASHKDDSLKVNALISLTIAKYQSAPDKAKYFANQAKTIAEKINFKTGEAYAYKWLGIINNSQGNYYDALLNSNQSLAIFESLDDKVGTSNLLSNLGAFYADRGEDSKAVEYYLKSLDLAQQSENKLRIETALSNIGVIYSKNSATNNKALEYYLKALPYALDIKDDESTGIIYTNIGEAYTNNNNLEKAWYYYNQALKILDNSLSTAYTYNDIGKLYIKKNNYDSAAIAFNKAYTIAQQNNSLIDVVQSLIGKAKLQMITKNFADAIHTFNQALPTAKSIEATPELKEIYSGLSTGYQNIKDYKSAFSSQNELTNLFNAENEKRLNFNTAILEYTMQLQKQSGQIASLERQNELQEINIAKQKLARNVLIGGVAILLVFAFVLLFNNKQRKRLNKILSRQKKEIETQKQSVEKALIELKATQSQLIHSEKMASLGELTAGVAHEIQNPLNFINNFSEVNTDLMKELKEEMEKGNMEDVKAIADDITENEKKILHHGKRAEAIVKGMLQHSRKNSGKKEFTDINALCAEFLRLTYHNINEKDKSLSATYTTHLDKHVGKINIVPQDIASVLVNLFNNAFYAVNEKQRAESLKQNTDYKPEVSVQTKKLDSPSGNGDIEIKVIDNGNGIPESIKEKIFQPFFTTKPTGEGTGLGLSLAYDIITKEHNGTIKVESKEGEGTAFTIELPAL